MLYSCVTRFPKKDRFTIGQKSEQTTLKILELLFAANAAANQKRLVLLERVDLKLKILKTLIRLAHDVRALDQKKYLMLEEQLFEIGRMLGGWIKETKTNH